MSGRPQTRHSASSAAATDLVEMSLLVEEPTPPQKGRGRPLGSKGKKQPDADCGNSLSEGRLPNKPAKAKPWTFRKKKKKKWSRYSDSEPDDEEKENDVAVSTKLEDRVAETEKKLAVILCWIKNQYGEEHDIIQLVKSSLGQPLNEPLVNNVGKCSERRTEPLLAPPIQRTPYPRHVWIPRDEAKTDLKSFELNCPKLEPIPNFAKRTVRVMPNGKPNLTKRRPVQESSKPEPQQYEFDTFSSLSQQQDDDVIPMELEEFPFQILSTMSIAPDEFVRSPSPIQEQLHYNCNECKKRFISVRQLAKHSLIHKTDSDIIVPSPSPTPIVYKTHKKSNTQINDKTHKKSNTQINDKTHKKSNTQINDKTHKKHNFYRKPGPKSRTDELNKHDEIPCELCGKILLSRNSYNYHKIIQHSNRKTIFICPVCSKCYSSNMALKEHHDTHGDIGSGENKCSICFQTFFNSASLKRHIGDVHTKRLTLAGKDLASFYS